jgi:hypothetical protein
LKSGAGEAAPFAEGMISTFDPSPEMSSTSDVKFVVFVFVFFTARRGSS